MHVGCDDFYAAPRQQNYPVPVEEGHFEVLTLRDSGEGQSLTMQGKAGVGRIPGHALALMRNLKLQQNHICCCVHQPSTSL